MTDRRLLLKLAAASATTLWLPRSAWSAPVFRSNPFTLGVASGSPLHDSVVLWTRLVQAGLFGGNGLGKEAITVHWEVAHDEGFRRIARKGQVQALSELAHSVHAQVGGLEPDRWYFYRFMAGDATSAVGRTRTLPAPDAVVARLRLAYASCQRWEHGYYAAYRHMLAEQVDAVAFLGDYIYEYPNARGAVRVPTGGWVVTLDDYRQRYALHKSDTDLQAMHAACPWLVIWDDHEVQNDYAGLQAGDSGPQLPSSVSGFAGRRAAAYQAFYEHMPLRASVLTRGLGGLAAGAEMRVYDQVRFGQLATVYLLDVRQYKDPQACTSGDTLGSSRVNPANCAIWQDPNRTMLGAAQEQWLDQALATGSPGWNVVAQTSLFGMRDSRAGSGRSLWNDGWDGYSPARARLTDSLQRHGTANPVLLGGDVHESWVGHVKADYYKARSAVVGVEFCGTSITSRGGTNERVPELLEENPHFVFGEAEQRGYGIAEFTPGQLTTTLRVVDDVTRRDAAVGTQAVFRVASGKPVVERQ